MAFFNKYLAYQDTIAVAACTVLYSYISLRNLLWKGIEISYAREEMYGKGVFYFHGSFFCSSYQNYKLVTRTFAFD